MGISRHKNGYDLPDIFKQNADVCCEPAHENYNLEGWKSEAWVAKLLHELKIEEGLDIGLVLYYLSKKSFV